MLAVGRGVFELTGYRDADLLGRDVVEALGLSDARADRRRCASGACASSASPRGCGRASGIEKDVVLDLFPAYDDDGGLLVALTPA